MVAEVTLETLNDSVEKIAHYLANHVATKKELQQKADKEDVQKLLEGQDRIAQQLGIIHTEQVAFNQAFNRLENRVEKIEKIH